MTGWLANAGALWLAAGAILAGLELVVPGVFLIFAAIAAAATGVIAFALPAFPAELQWLSFAAWTGVSVTIGRRWYTDYPVATSEPLLNDRAAQLVGRVVTVSEAIAHGHGRVRVGDSEWPARGHDAPVGAKVRIVGSESSQLDVVPVEG